MLWAVTVSSSRWITILCQWHCFSVWIRTCISVVYFKSEGTVIQPTLFTFLHSGLRSAQQMCYLFFKKKRLSVSFIFQKLAKNLKLYSHYQATLCQQEAYLEDLSPLRCKAVSTGNYRH